MTGTMGTGRRSSGGLVSALVISIVAAAVFFAAGNAVPGFAVFPVAGLIAGSAVRSRVSGLSGVLAGTSLAFLVWGVVTVMEQVRICQAGCDWLSSPSLTFGLVVFLALFALILSGAGFLLGRLLRHVTVPVGSGPR